MNASASAATRVLEKCLRSQKWRDNIFWQILRRNSKLIKKSFRRSLVLSSLPHNILKFWFSILIFDRFWNIIEIFFFKKTYFVVKISKPLEIWKTFLMTQAQKTYFSARRGAIKYVFLAFVVKNIVRNEWETSIPTNVFRAGIGGETSYSLKSAFHL